MVLKHFCKTQMKSALRINQTRGSDILLHRKHFAEVTKMCQKVYSTLFIEFYLHRFVAQFLNTRWQICFTLNDDYLNELSSYSAMVNIH